MDIRVDTGSDWGGDPISYIAGGTSSSVAVSNTSNQTVTFAPALIQNNGSNDSFTLKMPADTHSSAKISFNIGLRRKNN